MNAEAVLRAQEVLRAFRRGSFPLSTCPAVDGFTAVDLVAAARHVLSLSVEEVDPADACVHTLLDAMSPTNVERMVRFAKSQEGLVVRVVVVAAFRRKPGPDLAAPHLTSSLEIRGGAFALGGAVVPRVLEQIGAADGVAFWSLPMPHLRDFAGELFLPEYLSRSQWSSKDFPL